MKSILKNRLALSTVVTTLIILVVSVLLAGVVTYFAINVTSTRVQEESLQLTKLHVWYDSGSSAAQGAFMIINTGGRDVVINKITVRGQQATWTNVYTKVAAPTDDLAFSSTLTTDNKYYTMTGGVSTAGSAMTAASGDITLASGDSMVVYINSPDSITINDIGLTVGITVFTSQAMYYQEANVQST
jgi:Archaeal Type IV pilin, N-terminal